MLSKIKNIHLIIILVVLVSLVLLFRYVNKSKDSNFSKDTISIKSENIVGFTIYPKISKPEKLNFYLDKKNGYWNVNKDDSIKANVGGELIQKLFDELKDLKFDRLVSRNKDKWSSYDLQDSLSTKLEIKYKDKSIKKIYIGRTAYSQYNPNRGGYSNFKTTTYFRVGEGKSVYAVENGTIDFINNSFNYWRNKELIKLSTADLAKIDFKYDYKESFSINKNSKGKWEIDSKEVDSAAIVDYIADISSLSVDSNYLNNYEPKNEMSSIYFQLSNKKSVKIKMYEDKDFNAITSNINPNTFFKVNKKGDALYSKIFKNKDNFEKK